VITSPQNETLKLVGEPLQERALRVNRSVHQDKDRPPSHNFEAQAEKIFKAIFEVAQQFPDGRLPELFAGYRRTARSKPIPYPETCSPQAWAAGALPFMLTSSLGLEPDALNRRLRVVRPALPAFLGEVTMRGVRIGEATADLSWRRRGAKTEVRVLGTQGELQVVIDESVRGERDGSG